MRCAPQAGIRGVDAGKKTNGRKRHLVVDTLGLLLVVFVTAGSVQDRVAAPILLGILAKRHPRLKHVWADGGYSGELVTWAHSFLGWVVEIVHGISGQRGFVVRPRRWVVERSIAWLTRCRRLSRDFEGRPETTEAWCYLANIRLMSRRLDPAA